MNRYCSRCGKMIQGNGSFCSGCGAPIMSSQNNYFNYNNQKKKGLPTWAIILICVFGFLLLVGIVSDDEDSKKGNDSSNNTEEKNNSTNEKKKESNKLEDKGDSNNLNAITNETLKANFINACKQINMDVSKIKDLEKKDDWHSGPRYTFLYEGHTFVLYALDKGDVSSITIANNLLDKIYLDGYEPVDVNNFLFDSSTRVDLQVKAEEKIKSHIKYPDTSKFNWTEYSYARRYDIYQISGSFKAKNALNVEIDHKFTIEFKREKNGWNIVYLIVNNDKYVGTSTQMKEIVRKEIQSKEQKEDGSIILKDGTAGTYGKKDKFDGEDYIRYYIPAGTYKAEAITKNAQFFVETIKLHKENGYDAATTIKNVKLKNVGDTDTFTISKDQCISLVMYTQVRLTKIK